MSIAKLWKSKISKISRFLLIFLVIFSWIFSGYPQIWQNPPIPPKIQESRAFATLTYVGGNSGTGTGATYSVSLTGLTGGIGSAAAAGDLVIVVTGWASAADGNPGVTTPTDYTEVYDLYKSDTRDVNFSANYKIMGATPDTSVTVSGFNNAANGGATVVHVWRGADQTTPMDVTPPTGATAGNAALPNSPSITPVTTGAYVLTVGMGTDDATPLTQTAPTGYGNARSTAGTGSTMSIVANIASKAWTSGAEDPAAWTGGETSTSDSWAAGTLAIRPAPSSPTVTTQSATAVTATTATLNGNITATGGANATVRGFAWGTNSALSGGDTATTTENGSFGTGAFTDTSLTLICNTTYYSRAYATNSAGTGLGAISASFTTSACASITLIVDTDNFLPLTPGTPRFATSTVSVNTNKSTGWYVTLERVDADTTLDRDGDTTVDITDQAAWVPGAATTTAGNAVKISSLGNSQRVLAFRVMTASSTNGSMFFAPSWWGSEDSYIDNINTLWAGIPAPSSNQKIGNSSVSSGGSPALNTVLYYLDVPNTQKTGAYSGSIIFTAVMNE